MKWLKHLLAWWQFHRDLRAAKDCDGCGLHATLGELSACSGDIWLCNKCLRKYLFEDET